jgi:acetyl-CoA carboxylase carboxyltransferase component
LNLAVAPLAGTIAAVLVSPGEEVASGRPLVLIESMKMEHEVPAPVSGRVVEVSVSVGDVVAVGDRLAVLEQAKVAAAEHADGGLGEPGGAGSSSVSFGAAGTAPAGTAPAGTVPAGTAPAGTAPAADEDRMRDDLAEVVERHAMTSDERRPEAVQKRHSQGHRSARENLAALCDPESFVEYGALAIAAQRDRRSIDELVRATPADGLIGGLASVNGGLFGEEAARCVVVSYDYTVLAGTQGWQGHRKKDRLFELAERMRLPVVLFAEGGGGRPGDTSAPAVSGLEVTTFATFARLSALVPLVGVVAGRCFAGNAALLGCCDVIIATEDSSVGMAGPAMIEGGGLGTFHPDEIGPTSVQAANGVIDVVVPDDASAVSVARQYLGYFQGALEAWSSPDQRLLRDAVPEERSRVYDMRSLIQALADQGSVLELRAGWAPGMITALVRLEGRPLGVLANNPAHLGGAIDADGADKAARFLQLCDAHDLPVLALCDTPGFMVGPEAERHAQLRHFARLFLIGASLTVPYVCVVVRKGYGLGAQAMAAGSFRSPALIVAWPTGEIGGMGLEGAVRLGFRRELEAEQDPAAEQALFDRLVAAAYRNGKALNAAANFEIDDVIDPATTRRVVLGVLRSARAPQRRLAKKRPCIDAW